MALLIATHAVIVLHDRAPKNGTGWDLVAVYYSELFK